MSDAVRLKAQRAAAEYLRQLLLKPGAYRDTWQCHVARRRGGPRRDVINQLAIAEVIAGRSILGVPGGDQVMPYQLRDVVSGALSGSQLSSDTLRLFVEAFGFSEEEAGRLQRLLSGSSRIGVMSGSGGVPLSTEEGVEAALGPRQHQTVSLHDHVSVGSDTRIDRCRTMHVIEAIAPDLDRVPVVVDTNVLTIEVGQGCKELTGELRAISESYFATEILLSRALELGETLTLEYWLSYRYAGDPLDPAEREYRRAVMRQLDNLDMRIEFHADRLPAYLWWAHWDGSKGTILEQEPITLDIQHSAHRYVRSVEKTVVGFHWRWE